MKPWREHTSQLFMSQGLHLLSLSMNYGSHKLHVFPSFVQILQYSVSHKIGLIGAGFIVPIGLLLGGPGRLNSFSVRLSMGTARAAIRATTTMMPAARPSIHVFRLFMDRVDFTGTEVVNYISDPPYLVV